MTSDDFRDDERDLRNENIVRECTMKIARGHVVMDALLTQRNHALAELRRAGYSIQRLSTISGLHRNSVGKILTESLGERK